MYEKFGIFIRNTWRAASDGGTLPVIDPATEEIVGTIPKATAHDLDACLAAAAEGFRKWRAEPPYARSVMLRQIAARLRDQADASAVAMSRECGKPVAEARGELIAAAEQFEWYAEEARRIYGQVLDGRDSETRLHVRYHPLGPVAAFTAWNFPALLMCRKVAAALAAGCSVIGKPSEEAPHSIFALAEATRQAGLPDGVFSVVTGDPAMISGHLIASPIIRKVSFTGSVPVGKKIAALASQSLKKVSLELGGHAPVIVMPDVDVAEVAQACARVKFRNAGQVCISPSRFFVHEDIYDAFASQFAAHASKLVIGIGTDPKTEMGPMANARGRDRAESLIADAVERGADRLAGGGRPAGQKRGYFLQPTVLGRVSDQARIMTEEPFAPIAPIAAFKKVEEAIERSNALPFGLAAYAFTRSLKYATQISEQLEAGMVGVNDLLLAAAEMPFGGIKSSGSGREGGSLGIYDYLDAKYIKLRLS